MNYKPNYFTTYAILSKFWLLIIFCFWLVCCAGNEIQQVLPPESGNLAAETAVNINSASAAELEKLPAIGEKLAQKIVAHRETYGPFRRPEHLLLVRGFSDEQLRRIRNLIKIE